MLRTILWIWLVTEILFGMYFLQRRKHLQASATPPKLTRNERQALFETCVQTVNDIESYLSGWFYYYYNDKRIKPPLADIYRGNLAQWLAWALWMDDITHLSDKEQQHLSDMIDLLERRFSVTFRPGVNYLVGCIRPNLDPVEAFYRPLVIYLAIYSLRFAFTRYLVLMKGFKRVSLGCLVYYTHTSPCQRATPLVFVHGLGLGLTCYATLIHALHRIQRPIYLVELPFIIIRLHQGRAPSPETLVHAIEAMLDRHAHPKAVILAHSLGTVITSWVALKAPQRLAGMVLVDPVCFLLNYHHIAYNILHRVPQRWIESFFQYGAMRELSISHYISRQFYWYQSVLFPNEKTAPMAVYLSEKDTIIDSRLVADYLQTRGMDVHLMPGLQHAGFLIDAHWRDQILAKVDKLANQPIDEAIKGLF